MEKIQNHVTISWDFGKDISHLLKYIADPKIPEPTDMTVAKEVVNCKVRLCIQEVDRYGDRRTSLEGKKGAMYALLMDGVSKIIKLKLKIKTGYSKADEAKYSVWLLKTLEDIVINFEEVKPKLLAIND